VNLSELFTFNLFTHGRKWQSGSSDANCFCCTRLVRIHSSLRVISNLLVNTGKLTVNTFGAGKFTHQYHIHAYIHAY
jgi:hypothetical protein